jgi:S1-C subfamily serine protease
MPTDYRDGKHGFEPLAGARDPRIDEATIRSAARRRLLALAFGIAVLGPTAARPDDKGAAPGKATAAEVLRPTVQIRNGTRRGSGTILASAPDETLILTAAHVVSDPAELKVELHRHNLGGPIAGLTEGGGWPRLVPAALVAADPAADVAIVRITGMVALPHVARFDPGSAEPAEGDVLTSVGIDRTLFLRLWRTTAQGTARVDIGRGGGARRFILTTRYPDHGRSGGGLYREDGALVGVCVGQLSLRPGQPKVGIFASSESIRRLLHDNDLDRALRAAAPGASRARKRTVPRS